LANVRSHGLHRRILGAAAACLGIAAAPGAVDSTQLLPAPLPVPAPGTLPFPEHEPEFATPTTHDRVGRVVAAVHINGLGPFRFILDTGANRSAMSERAVRAVALTPTRQAMVHGITGSAVMPLVVVKELRAGGLLFKDLGVAILPDAVFADVDGILGIDCLQHARIDIDFADDRVTIGRSGKSAARDRYVVRAKVHHRGLLLVPARVGKVRVKAIIDTGAERSLGNVALRDALALRERKGFDGDITNVVGATAHVAEGISFVTPTIDFGGGAYVGNLTVTFGDFHVFKIWLLLDEPALVVGMDVLGTLPQMTIDYPRREIQLKIPREALSRAL